MLLIRYCEEAIGTLVEQRLALCPCHLGIGQEAIAVGVAAALTSDDRVFGTHRSHTQFLAMGGSVRELMAEVLGKADGCSKGMGGSMHLYDPAHGFHGSVPIVGATVPLAVGAALAAQKDKRGACAAAFFGDGAAEEGVVHECLNLCAVYKLPLLFVCENNLFSSHLHIDLRQPSNSIARYADAHCVPNAVIDGNDVVNVNRVASEAVAAMRQGSGPFFLEAVTYRWRGHVGHREDTDVGVQRKDDLVKWKDRDPVGRLAAAMKSGGWLADEDYETMKSGVRTEVSDAVEYAMQAPYPAAEQLLGPVYSGWSAA